MIAADRFLARLDGVKAAGDHRWSARCPAHDDKSPSLSIREEADGRLLICCHAGCRAVDVVQAVSLTLADLFERPLAHHVAPVRDPLRPRVNPAEVLASIDHEALVVAIIAEQLARGEPLAAENHRRLIRAANTISRAVEASVRAEPPELRRIRRGEARP